MASGIYQIENQINGNRYIGSAMNLKKRRRDHLSALRRGRHYNSHLQAAFNKYGEAIFVFEILERVEDSMQLIACEQHYLDALLPEYNISPTAGSQLGTQHTEETKRKLSAANAGEQNPFYGKHLSEEARAKIGIAHKGKYPSEETRAKIRKALTGERNPNYGRHPSEETLAKMRAAHKREHLSEETLAKMSAAKTGERHPMYGKRHSTEARAKMRIAQRARRRKEREFKEE